MPEKCPSGYKRVKNRCIATVKLTEAEANIVWDGIKCRTSQMAQAKGQDDDLSKSNYERYKKLRYDKFDKLVGIHTASYYRRHR